DGGAARSSAGGVRDLARGDRDREWRTSRERILEDEGALMRTGGRRPLLVALAILGLVALAAPMRAADEAPAVPITTADLKGISTPSTDDLAKGDPGGTLTGTAADIVMADPKAGVTITDVVNQVGQNRIAINFVSTLVAGFLVMLLHARSSLLATPP